MSPKIRKYLFFILLVGLTYLAYWYFYSASWGIAIDKEQIWKYALVQKSSASFKNAEWHDSTTGVTLPENKEDFNLVFQTEFSLDASDNVLDALLEYDYRYSTKILFNGVLYQDVSRNLIAPLLEKDKIKIMEFWRPQVVQIEHEFLKSNLKDGVNQITLIVYNLEEIKSIENRKKQLSFLNQGHKNNLKTEFNFEKPKSYFSESVLPIFKINTNKTAIPDEPKILSKLEIINNKNGVNHLLDSSLSYPIKIERRGNTSQTFAKKSYSLSICDDSLSKIAVPLLDLPASKNWVLYGPYADKSLIRNALTYALYNDMGNYAPRTQFVELIINNNYQGLYVLTERIQIGPDHLNIEPFSINTTDSSAIGGYIIEVDRNDWTSIYPK
jgi:hypothetical protein